MIHVLEKLGVRILYLANFVGAWRLATETRTSREIVFQASVRPLARSLEIRSPEP